MKRNKVKQKIFAVLSMTCLCLVLYFVFGILNYESAYIPTVICCLLNIACMTYYAMKKHFNLLEKTIVALLSISSCIIPIYFVAVKLFPVLRITLPFSVAGLITNILFFLTCQVARKVTQKSTPSDES